MKNEKAPNNSQLALLNLLAEKPMHAYEIAQVIDERGMYEWIPIGFSSIYFALNKMHQAGWLQQKQANSDIGGPQKYIYELTAIGWKIWKSSVITALSNPKSGENPFLIALSVLPLLEKDEIARALLSHLDNLQKTAQRLNEKIASYSSNAPQHVHAMFDLSLKQINASIAWIEQWLPIFGTN